MIGRLKSSLEKNRRWWILANMTGALSMMMIDATVVSVALPTIQEEFDASQAEVQWVMNAYLLALAALVAVGGRLGDMYGHARIFKIGVLVFIASSAAAGLAQSDSWLIGARAIEGGGAAIMIPATMAIVTNAFPASMRGRAMGIFAGISMVALALGPLVGGVLTELVTWRAIFFINLPIGALVIAVTYVTLRHETPAGGRLDRLGMVTLVGGLTAVVLALMQSSTWGWGSIATIGLLAGGLLALVVFVRIELRVDQPLVELRLFSSHNFSADVGVLAAVQFTLMGLTVFAAIWIQNVLGFNPIQAGLSLLPLTIPVLFAAPIAGRFYDRIGPRLLVGTGDRRDRVRLVRDRARQGELCLARARLRPDRHRDRPGDDADEHRRDELGPAATPRAGRRRDPDDAAGGGHRWPGRDGNGRCERAELEADRAALE
jgi:EmrB/QacA subfamily drug resistance transporter